MYSSEIHELLAVNSLDTFSATPSPLRQSPEHIRSLTRSPLTPLNLGESLHAYLSRVIGEQRAQLRAELSGWVAAAANTTEAVDRQDAAIKIISCFHNNFATLEIHTPNITNLPACIGFLRHLKTLDLSNCEALVSLPNVLDNFFNLKELNLTNCKNLVVLPNTVAALPGYSHLFLTGSGVNLANPLQSRQPNPQP